MAMTFDELWKRVPGLSKIAKEQVQDTLRVNTKSRLERYSPFEVGTVVRFAIDAIEHGRKELVDELVRRQIS